MPGFALQRLPIAVAIPVPVPVHILPVPRHLLRLAAQIDALLLLDWRAGCQHGSILRGAAHPRRSHVTLVPGNLVERMVTRLRHFGRVLEARTSCGWAHSVGLVGTCLRRLAVLLPAGQQLPQDGVLLLKLGHLLPLALAGFARCLAVLLLAALNLLLEEVQLIVHVLLIRHHTGMRGLRRRWAGRGLRVANSYGASEQQSISSEAKF